MRRTNKMYPIPGLRWYEVPSHYGARPGRSPATLAAIRRYWRDEFRLTPEERADRERQFAEIEQTFRRLLAEAV